MIRQASRYLVRALPPAVPPRPAPMLCPPTSSMVRAVPPPAVPLRGNRVYPWKQSESLYPWKQSLVTTGSQSIGILVGIIQSVNPGNEQSSKQSSATHATGAAQRARREGAARRAGHGAGGAAPRETKGGKLRTKKTDRSHQWPTEEGLMRPRTPHRRHQTPVKKVRQ